MSDQLIDGLASFRTYLPWVSFVAGLGGSLHCVGMCGGLVTASCGKSTDIIRYQFGRLLGYLFLGGIAGFFGEFISFKDSSTYYSLLPAIFIGVLFIYWGFKNYQGKKAELPVPRFMGASYQFLWKKLVKSNLSITRAFFTGLISILLPCGLLYGVVLSTVSLEHSYEALFSMFFFWLGTVPSMVVAPSVIQRLIRPLKSKLPRTFALSLMLIGVVTITLRVSKHYESLHSTQPIDCH